MERGELRMRYRSGRPQGSGGHRFGMSTPAKRMPSYRFRLPGVYPGEVGHEPLRLDLDQGRGSGHPRQPMPAETSKADAGRQRSLDGGLRLARYDDLSAVGHG